MERIPRNECANEWGREDIEKEQIYGEREERGGKEKRKGEDSGENAGPGRRTFPILR